MIVCRGCLRTEEVELISSWNANATSCVTEQHSSFVCNRALRTPAHTCSMRRTADHLYSSFDGKRCERTLAATSMQEAIRVADLHYDRDCWRLETSSNAFWMTPPPFPAWLSSTPMLAFLKSTHPSVRARQMRLYCMSCRLKLRTHVQLTRV